MVVTNTGRLRLQPFTLDDAPFILRLLNEPGFVRHIADKGVRDLEGARGYLREGPMASYERHGFGLWRVSLAGQDTAIGMAGLLKRDYLDDMDIGYAFLPEYGGMGYAFEAASAVMDHARGALGKRRVLAIVNEDNAASIRLLGKLGFEDDGVVRVPGAQRDVRLFAAGPTRRSGQDVGETG
jgi:[ribosomal protein S5]-alanine N-acetyltransferase